MRFLKFCDLSCDLFWTKFWTCWIFYGSPRLKQATLSFHIDFWHTENGISLLLLCSIWGTWVCLGVCFTTLTDWSPLTHSFLDMSVWRFRKEFWKELFQCAFYSFVTLRNPTYTPIHWVFSPVMLSRSWTINPESVFTSVTEPSAFVFCYGCIPSHFKFC